MIRYALYTLLGIYLLAVAISENRIGPNIAWANSEGESADTQWGGQLKIVGAVAWPNQNSIYQPVGTETFYDGAIDFRLKNETFLSERVSFQVHYEGVLSGGDRHRKNKELKAFFPGLSERIGYLDTGVDDHQRLMDLSHIVDQDENFIFYHRLDRLSLTLQPDWGMFRMGRQALTWGNGLIFNPMDLFNPFAPTDIERDYKIGDDMVTGQFALPRIGDLQMLYVPRRDSASHRIETQQSSLAGKLHFAIGATEFDIMGAKHFEDEVIGVGGSGYLGEAAWRTDLTWTFLNANPNGRRDHYPSWVANIDYAWVWFNRNFYGLIEFYYNGVGRDTYPDAILDDAVSERLNRGELFVLGTSYINAEIQVELHPLFKVSLTGINNARDPSGLILPRAIWDITQSLQMTFGANIYYGKAGTEFGGFTISGTDIGTRAPNGIYAWVTYFF